MTYNQSFDSAVDPLVTEATPLSRRSGLREQSLNAGYILFGLAALSVVVIGGLFLAPSTSIPECQLTALGDVAVCAPQQ
jgi:Ca2+/Na+ antiporter